MEKIYSKVDGRLLHVINRLEDITGRDDIIPEDNSKGWVRGGINSRDVFKQLDYKQRCNFKGNNNNINNNNLNAVN